MTEQKNISVEQLAEIYKKLNEQDRLLIYSSAHTLLVQQQMQNARQQVPEKAG